MVFPGLGGSVPTPLAWAVYAAAAVTAAAGGFAAAGGAAPPTVETAVVQELPHPKEPVARAVFDTLTGAGLSPAAAAGVLGNLEQESDFNPAAHEHGGGAGRGLAQWSVGGRWDTDRLNLIDYAESRGTSPWTLETQTAFMLAEMRSGVGGFDLGRFAAETDPVAAARYFHDVYEKSADRDGKVETVRGGAAREWFDWFNGAGGG